MQYFEHSTHAADDDKLMALRLEHGGAAIDCYWTLLEKMYRDEGPLALFGTDGETNVETKSVSHRLCVSVEELKTYVSAMLSLGLFEGDVENIVSERAMRNIESYKSKAEAARQNGKKGGRKPTRKPKGNQAGSKVGTDAGTEELATKQNKTKVIGFHKEKPITAVSDGAASAGAEPTATARCPMCSSPMRKTGMPDPDFWWCDACNDGFPESKGVVA